MDEQHFFYRTKVDFFAVSVVQWLKHRTPVNIAPGSNPYCISVGKKGGDEFSGDMGQRRASILSANAP